LSDLDPQHLQLAMDRWCFYSRFSRLMRRIRVGSLDRSSGAHRATETSTANTLGSRAGAKAITVSGQITLIALRMEE